MPSASSSAISAVAASGAMRMASASPTMFLALLRISSSPRESSKMSSGSSGVEKASVRAPPQRSLLLVGACSSLRSRSAAPPRRRPRRRARQCPLTVIAACSLKHPEHVGSLREEPVCACSSEDRPPDHQHYRPERSGGRKRQQPGVARSSARPTSGRGASACARRRRRPPRRRRPGWLRPVLRGRRREGSPRSRRSGWRSRRSKRGGRCAGRSCG